MNLSDNSCMIAHGFQLVALPTTSYQLDSAIIGGLGTASGRDA